MRQEWCGGGGGDCTLRTPRAESPTAPGGAETLILQVEKPVPWLPNQKVQLNLGGMAVTLTGSLPTFTDRNKLRELSKPDQVHSREQDTPDTNPDPDFGASPLGGLREPPEPFSGAAGQGLSFWASQAPPRSSFSQTIQGSQYRKTSAENCIWI